ncbi:hypothetical protein C7212DRAFT_361167 [Tuber magnatum]|uniref:WAP domain-containing protein n=1 Tax=Tuber magnatum TaxID=42249 RepID=A0A317T215_9PEZI|nr:hypothetical protein C7212DRAFT_361167 [Tuber magnatum]
MKKITLTLPLLLLPIAHANPWLPQTSSAPCAPSENSTWTLKTYPCTPQTPSTTSTFCCLPRETCQISTGGKAQCLPAPTNSPYHLPRPANCSGVAECPLFCKQSEFTCGDVCCPNGRACLSNVCSENLAARAEVTAPNNRSAQAHGVTPPPAAVPAVSRVPTDEKEKTTWVSGKALTAVIVVVVLLVVIALGIVGWVYLVRRRRRMERVRNSPAGLRAFPIVGYAPTPLWRKIFLYIIHADTTATALQEHQYR